MWMVPYSTLMLILLIFFAALFGLSYLESVEYETAFAMLESSRSSEGESSAMKEVILAKSIEKYIETTQLSDLAEVKISARFIKVKMNSPVLYDSGSAELKADIMPFFEELSAHLKALDNLIIVEGHTDNIPIHNELFKSNWELSAARAFSIISFFINQGIPPERLAAHGFGEFRPAYSNDTDEGKAKNRRIEITIERGGLRG